MSIDSSAISVSDSSQIFEHFTGELSSRFLQVAEKTANKVHKVSLKFIIEPAAIVQDLANPEILIPGAQPMWTKQPKAHDIRMFVQDKKLHVDRGFNPMSNVIPHIQTAKTIQIHAKFYTPPGSGQWDTIDDVLADEKIWNYSVKNS
jgi:hypothetical protein